MTKIRIALAFACSAFAGSVTSVTAGSDTSLKGGAFADVGEVATLSPPRWTGFHVGAGVGVHGMMYNQLYTSTTTNAVIQDFNNIVGLAGLGYVEAGYDQEIWPGVVIGVFADIDRPTGGHHFTSSAGTSNRYEEQYSWAIGGRLGKSLNAHQLWYATGGYTQSRFTLDVDATNLKGPFTKQRSGWFAGFGVDTALTDSLGIKMEYRYADYERAVQLVLPTSIGEPSVQTQEFRVGLSYKFGRRTSGTQQDQANVQSDWTGFYVGAGLGHALFSAAERFEATSGLSNESDGVGNDNIIGYVQAGYDYQINSRILFGGFVGLDFGKSTKEQTRVPATINSVTRVEQEPGFSIGARIGYTFSNTSMIYALGGFSRNKFTGEHTLGGITQGIDSQWVNGAIFGLGTEARITDHVSLKFEYRFEALDSTRPLETNQTNVAAYSLLDPEVHSARLGISYRFDVTR